MCTAGASRAHWAVAGTYLAAREQRPIVTKAFDHCGLGSATLDVLWAFLVVIATRIGTFPQVIRRASCLASTSSSRKATNSLADHGLGSQATQTVQEAGNVEISAVAEARVDQGLI